MGADQQLQWLGPGEIGDSTNIAGIAHDQLTGTLYVRFYSGTEYKYMGVDKEVFGEFALASSPGEFFHDYIKPYYDYEKM